MSLTNVFDTMCDIVVDNDNVPFESQKEIVEVLYSALRDQGWDDEHASSYSNHVWVAEVLGIEFEA